MPRRGTSKNAVAPFPQCPTSPFRKSQTPQIRGLRHPPESVSGLAPVNFLDAHLEAWYWVNLEEPDQHGRRTANLYRQKA
jgi:hypothetical protein